MARRRKVVAPSAQDLEGIEAEFRRETLNRPNAALAPISQVAAETAQMQSALSTQEREATARNQHDADAHREAVEQGRVIDLIALDEINENALVRDRTILDASELTELKNSIASHGLRLPIEVFRKEGEKPFGLISGYRRMHAFRELFALTGDAKYQTIKAIIRDPDALGGTITAMVEENEVRASLSHYERGRIAVIAAQQGVFPTAAEAVNQLFNAGSKAKRSKIRSFSLIFEELGDMLEFPEDLREKDGLRVATALRAGGEARFREALADGNPANAKEEWACLEVVAQEFEAEAVPQTKGGRPKTRTPALGWQGRDILHLSSGITLEQGVDSHGYVIRLRGKALNPELVSMAMSELQRLLEK
ncbi:ParB-like nuclease [Rhodobacterales bacterium HTCC2150]|nr:ParB-like nuclease [Rhodobacterales bacterium HTCC2150] [Rhodobacteraceae bacterium HTCC2150]